MPERITNVHDELIAALYAAATEMLPASRPLELLAELTRSDKVLAAHFNFDQRRGAITASHNVEPHFIETYEELYSSQNPWLARASYFQAEGLVWRGNEIIETARLKETEFFKLFLYGQGIERTAHIVVRVRGPEVFHVILTRRPNAEDYDDAAIEICRLYARHARQAIEIANAGATRRFVQDGFGIAIDEMAAGVALVEPPSTILHMNQTFAAFIGSLNGSSLGSQLARPPGLSQFPGSRPAEARLPRPLAEALAANPVPSYCTIQTGVDEGTRPISVGIRPIRMRGGPGGISRSGFILVYRGSDVGLEIEEAPLRAAYFLTAAEARICAGLVSGENVHVLSERLGISPQTARTHLKRIYDKTSTTRQSELLRVLMTFAYRRKPAAVPAAEHRLLVAPTVLPLRHDRGLLHKE